MVFINYLIKINNIIMLKKLTTEEFISKAKEVHGDKYDYSLVEDINSRTKNHYH